MRANVPVEVVEERQEVETQFQEALFFVTHERPEDFGCVEQVVIVDDPVRVRAQDVLVGVVGHKRDIEHERDPLATEQEERREERLRAHLRERELRSARLGRRPRTLFSFEQRSIGLM